MEGTTVEESKILEFLRENQDFDYKTLSELSTDVSKALDVDHPKAFSAISNLLKNGDLILSGGQKIIPIDRLNLKKGKLTGNHRGFCFCRLEGATKEDPDVFIPHVKLHGALNKDTVLIKVVHLADGKLEGEVFKIVKRNEDNIVGTLLLTNNKYAFVKPDDNRNFYDIFVKLDKNFKGKHQDKVVVKLTNFDNKNPEGKITEILGQPGQKGVDILSVIREFNLYEDFGFDVMEEARAVPQTVLDFQKQGRTNFCDEIVVTIDGEDSKDFDDAISINKTEDGGFVLGVHIADVSHYVKPNSALDKEAYKRATSVYFCDRVLPMLPEELSNGICSLNPGVERLTMSVVIEMDHHANIKHYKICEGVIKSSARMTYTDVFAILQGNKETTEKYKDIAHKFFLMEELHNLLEKKLKRRGALELDVPEAKIVLNEYGAVVDVVKVERNTAHKLIESFMLLANQVVAYEAVKKKIPCMFRVHEQPDGLKMRNFFDFCSMLGLHVNGQPDTVRPKDLQQVLFDIQGRSYEEVVNKVMLRSLQKARYSSKNLGHFGLAADYYCHFTSPIRRYPDLVVHRALKSFVLGKADENKVAYFEDFVADASILSSEREKLAESAERAVDDLKKAEFMQTKIGEEFDATVSGVNTFGVFVELDNTVEGLCAEENLPKDLYAFVENQYLLKGKNHSFQLGQKVRVQVVSTNLMKRQIDFKIVENSKKMQKNT